MERFNDSKITLLVWAFVLALVLTAGSANADFTFGEPVNLETVIPVIQIIDTIECFSYDGLEMYINSYNRAGGYGEADLWVLKRASVNEDWGPPENLGPVVNTAKDEYGASISVDGLTLYFNSDIGRQWPDIYVTTRPTKNAPWGPPVSLGPKVNTPDGNGGPWISPNGLELYFWSYKSGGCGRCDIYVIKRATMDDPWGDPVNLGPVVNSTTEDISPCLSPDGLLLFFCDNYYWGDPPRPGGYGGNDMWMTRRASLSHPWQPPVNLGPRVNRSGHESGPRISPDGRTLFFWSGHDPATWANWQSSIIPIVDFNGDGIVDIADVAIMIEHWHTDYSLCDIGPMPWGDGFVDAQDLIVLAEHLFEETPPAQ